MASSDGNFVDGFGDLTQPESMLYYKLDLAIKYRDLQLENPGCTAGDLHEIIEHIGKLRAQLNELQDSKIALQGPSSDDIKSIKGLVAQVEALSMADNGAAKGLGLLQAVADQTVALAPQV